MTALPAIAQLAALHEAANEYEDTALPAVEVVKLVAYVLSDSVSLSAKDRSELSRDLLRFALWLMDSEAGK